MESDSLTPHQRIERAETIREGFRNSPLWRIVKAVIQRHQQEAFDRWQAGKELEGDRFVTRAHAAVLDELQFMLKDGEIAQAELAESQREQEQQSAMDAAALAHQAEIDRLLK